MNGKASTKPGKRLKHRRASARVASMIRASSAVAIHSLHAAAVFSGGVQSLHHAPRTPFYSSDCLSCALFG